MTETAHGRHQPWQALPDGCDISASCLQWPAPVCRYDDLPAFTEWWQERDGVRGLTMEQMADMSAQEIADHRGITIRSAHRWRRKALGAMLATEVGG